MKKLFLLLSFSIFVFQISAMQYRVAAKKMHERVQKQPKSYCKVPEQEDFMGEPRAPHRNRLVDCAGSDGWGKKLFGLVLCTMLVTAAAAPSLASTKSFAAQAYEDDALSLRPTPVSDVFGTAANSTQPLIDDDGTCCLAQATDYRQVCPAHTVKPLYAQSFKIPSMKTYPASASIMKMIKHYKGTFGGQVQINTTILPLMIDDLTATAGVATEKRMSWAAYLKNHNFNLREGTPYLSIMIFNPQFFACSDGYQRGIVLHELFHIAQFNPRYDAVVTIDPATYPNGPDQEADANAILYLLHENCVSCAYEYTSRRPERSSQYLTRAEAEKLMDKTLPTWRDELASREDSAHLDRWAAAFVEGGY